MIKILIASHAQMASGMKASAEFFFGPCSQLTALDAYVDHQSFEKQVQDYLAEQKEEDQILFLSDLYGGSVNQILARFMSEKENVRLISGINFPLVLELLEWNETELSDTQLNTMITQARNLLCQVVLNEVKPDEFF